MKIQEILTYLSNESIPYRFAGDIMAEVEGFSSLTRYKPDSFTWIKTQANIPEGVDLSQLTLVFTGEDTDTGSAPNVIRTSESKRAFFSTMEHFYAQEEEWPAIGQFTYISPKVTLGKNVRIGHNCTLDGDITIGDDTVIWHNVTILNRVTIGKRCEIQSGAVIGHDGFSYTEDENRFRHMGRHFGGVTIGNDVLIGSGDVISRGVIDDTILMDGVKSTYLAHIAHNCIVEKGAVIHTGSILNGSCRIGEYAEVTPGAIVRNQCAVGKSAMVGMGAVAVKDVSDNTIVTGIPAKPFQKKKD